jgi:hypothetical protein
MNSRIAFSGYSRCGKDTAAEILLSHGYEQRSMGDLIRKDLAPVFKSYNMPSPWSVEAKTGDRAADIRKMMESWGEYHYDRLIAEFFDTLPETCVNTRITLPPEASRWTKLGGIIIEVHKPGLEPSTPWERKCVTGLQNAGLIHATIINNGNQMDLQAALMKVIK